MMTRRMAILLAGLVPSFATRAHAQQTKLTVMVFRGGQNLPLFAAQEKDFFARRGLWIYLLAFAPVALFLAQRRLVRLAGAVHSIRSAHFALPSI